MVKPIKLPEGVKYFSQVLDEGLVYIDDRRKGRVKSLLTPWMGLNAAGINGIEWNSLITLGARPGSGKTMMVSHMIRDSKKLNPTLDFNVIEFQFEMGPKQVASRYIAAEMALDYNVLLSTEESLNDFIYERCCQVSEDTKELERQGVYRIFAGTAITYQQMKDLIYKLYNDLGGKPLVITIDHSWLIKKASDEKEKIATLYNGIETLVALKNDLPIIIIMLTQLNRNVDDPLRKVPQSIANYPSAADIFGGDALVQASEMVMCMMRPHLSGMKLYGPKGYSMMEDEIALHLIKVRNAKHSANNNIIFLKALFDRGMLVESPEPQALNKDADVTSDQFIRRSVRQRLGNGCSIT